MNPATNKVRATCGTDLGLHEKPSTRPATCGSNGFDAVTQTGYCALYGSRAGTFLVVAALDRRFSWGKHEGLYNC